VDRSSSPEQPFVLYRLSYLYFNVLGCFIVIAVGLVVSFLTGATSPRELHPDLLSPVMHWTLPKEEHKDQYQPVKQAVDLKTAR
jgi:multisubunit Na+/H+ antiporter MnhB subunit